MATLTADELALIRDEIGDTEPPYDEDIQDVYDRMGDSLTKTVLQILKKRLATLLSGGAFSFTVVGEYSENRSANVQALERQISRITGTGISDEGPVLGKITVGSLGRTWGR